MSGPRLWGGRFAADPADALARLSRSVHVDWRLADHDLAGSRAHARALRAAGLLTDDELGRLLAALDDLRAAVASGAFTPTDDDEDVHTALERGLLQRLGPLGGKLRAGRSRNDQVASDLRRYLREVAGKVVDAIGELGEALAARAEELLGVPAPGLTHLQHAQPVLFSHLLLAHAQPLARDVDRLRDWDRRTAVSVLGAGALAGSSLGLDAAAVARELGFERVAANSIDAVADRDFAAEFVFAAALAGVHLSGLGEDLVLWSTAEFGWIELADEFATGSSLLPQKKNPDVAELARGKAGRLIGDLTALLTTLKGLPLAYDRDLQEDKEPVFDAADTLLLVLPALTGLVATMRVDRARLAAAAPAGFALAADLAEELVRGGVPFREAHDIVGRLVRDCADRGRGLAELPAEELGRLAPALAAAVGGLDVSRAIEARTGPGGTAPERVREQLAGLRAELAAARAWASGR